MIDQQMKKQLASSSSQGHRGALRHLSKMGKLPNEVREDIVRLFNAGPPYMEELVSLIIRNPGPDFEMAYQSLLREGTVSEQIQALQSLTLWMGESEQAFAKIVLPTIITLSSSANPWVAFLASLQRARLYADQEDCWHQAAKAIIAADTIGWHADIRPQIMEITTSEEQQLINAHLQILGVKQLSPNANIQTFQKRFQR